MPNFGIIVGFGFLVAVAVSSLFLFRRRSLGTRKRVILSILAVGLLISGMLRDGGIDASKLVIVVLAAVILGSGIFFLWRSEKLPPE